MPEESDLLMPEESDLLMPASIESLAVSLLLRRGSVGKDVALGMRAGGGPDNGCNRLSLDR